MSIGNDKTVDCASCHGTDLKGSTIELSIVGNFVNYTVCQLHGFKERQAVMMQGVVNGLTGDGS